MTRCKDISEVIASIRKQNLEIGDIYLVKFGTVTVSSFNVPNDAVHPLTERVSQSGEPFVGDENDASKKLREVLDKHPNIFNLKVIDESYFIGAYQLLGTRLLTGPVCHAEVHLPQKQQKYQDMDCEEHFSVLVSGTYFAAYSKVESLPPYSNMAHEFREIFRTQILNQTNWESPDLGPCPMHPDIIVIEVASTAPSQISAVPLFFIARNDLYIVVKPDSFQKIIHRIFRECISYLGGYYELALQRVALIYSDIEIQNRLGSLVESYNEFSTAPFWNWKINRKALGRCRDELAKIYELRVEHSRGVRGYSDQRQGFLGRIKGAALIGELKKELKADTVLDVEIPDTLFHSLQFFQQQVESKRGTYALVLASLIGALIGGFITAAATLLHSQK